MTEQGDRWVVQVSLDRLLIDPSFQIRSEVKHSDVREYAEAMRAGDVFPPILIGMLDEDDPSRGYVLIDGWHRVEASRAIGRTKVDALVHPDGDPTKYRWLAAKMNQTHGIRLKRKERREVFRAYVKAGEHLKGQLKGTIVKSAREMSKDLKGIVSDRTIPLWMAQDFPFWYARMMELDVDERGLAEVDIRDKMKDQADYHLSMLAQSYLEQYLHAMSLINSRKHQARAAKGLGRVVAEVEAALGGKVVREGMMLEGELEAAF